MLGVSSSAFNRAGGNRITLLRDRARLSLVVAAGHKRYRLISVDGGGGIHRPGLFEAELDINGAGVITTCAICHCELGVQGESGERMVNEAVARALQRRIDHPAAFDATPILVSFEVNNVLPLRTMRRAMAASTLFWLYNGTAPGRTAGFFMTDRRKLRATNAIEAKLQHASALRRMAGCTGFHLFQQQLEQYEMTTFANNHVRIDGSEGGDDMVDALLGAQEMVTSFGGGALPVIAGGNPTAAAAAAAATVVHTVAITSETALGLARFEQLIASFHGPAPTIGAVHETPAAQTAAAVAAAVFPLQQQLVLAQTLAAQQAAAHAQAIAARDNQVIALQLQVAALQ